MTLLVLGAAAFVASLILTGFARRIAMKLGLVARPVADRWHRTTVPLLGGLAIAVPVMVSLSLSATPVTIRAALVLGPLAMLVVGLADDVRPVRPRWKLAAQFGLAAGVAASGVQLRLTDAAAVNVALTIVWIVGVTNAFNLLDNMDGLAGGIAAVTVAFRLAFFVIDGNLEGAAIAALFVGSVAGFLVYNFPPASIFMGDAGSLFIGSFVAILCLTGGYPYSRNVVSVLLIPALIVLVPILDTSFVTFTRTMSGRPIYVGGRDHLSHRLVEIGLRERAAVIVLYGVAAVSGGVAIASYRFGIAAGLTFITMLAAGTLWFGLRLVRNGGASVGPVPPPESETRLSASGSAHGK